MSDVIDFSVTEEVFNKALKDFYVWVDAQLKSLEMKQKMLKNSDPTFDDLNLALAQTSDTIDGLNSLYTNMKLRVTLERDKYTIWFNKMCYDERNAANKDQPDKKLWLSQKEVEAMVMAKYADEVGKRLSTIDNYEAKRSYLERKVETWKGYSFAVSQISRNKNTVAMIQLKDADTEEIE